MSSTAEPVAFRILSMMELVAARPSRIGSCADLAFCPSLHGWRADGPKTGLYRSRSTLASRPRLSERARGCRAARASPTAKSAMRRSRSVVASRSLASPCAYGAKARWTRPSATVPPSTAAAARTLSSSSAGARCAAGRGDPQISELAVTPGSEHDRTPIRSEGWVVLEATRHPRRPRSALRPRGSRQDGAFLADAPRGLPRPRGHLSSLHDIQVRLLAFIGKHYHRAPHSGLVGRCPVQVYKDDAEPTELLTDDDLAKRSSSAHPDACVATAPYPSAASTGRSMPDTLPVDTSPSHARSSSPKRHHGSKKATDDTRCRPWIRWPTRRGRASRESSLLGASTPSPSTRRGH